MLKTITGVVCSAIHPVYYLNAENYETSHGVVCFVHSSLQWDYSKAVTN